EESLRSSVLPGGDEREGQEFAAVGVEHGDRVPRPSSDELVRGVLGADLAPQLPVEPTIGLCPARSDLDQSGLLPLETPPLGRVEGQGLPPHPGSQMRRDATELAQLAVQRRHGDRQLTTCFEELAEVSEVEVV